MLALSLFSGAGGDTLGLERAGYDVVGFVEHAEPMIQTHLANFPNSALIGRDIRTVTEDDLRPYIGRIHVIFAGFPCQAYSKGGKKDPNDPRAQLFREFVRITGIVRPDWVIGENVRHILRMTTPDGGRVTDAIADAFDAIGYHMAPPRVLKADAFGVPQKRERCFFVGSRDGIAFDWDWVTPPAPAPAPALRPILEPTLADALTITADQARAFGIPEGDRGVVTLPPDAAEPTGAPPLNLRKCLAAGQLSFGKRASPTHSEIVDPDRCSKTLICTYNRMPRMFVALRAALAAAPTTYLRPFTVREAQQIQGFPADYIICGNRTNALLQIGNAVPPAMVTAIATAILNNA